MPPASPRQEAADDRPQVPTWARGTRRCSVLLRTRRLRPLPHAPHQHLRQPPQLRPTNRDTMTDQVLQQLWEAYSAHEGRKHKRATRGLVTPADLDRFRADFNHIINTIKAETWWEACVRIADGENHLDIAHVYQKRNPYVENQ